MPNPYTYTLGQTALPHFCTHCELSKIAPLLTHSNCPIHTETPCMSVKNFGSLFEHFSNLTQSLAAENDIVVKRASLAAQMISEQMEILRMVLKRSEQSFQKMSNLVQQLCLKVADFNRQDPLISEAIQELQNEQMAWAELDKSVIIRKNRLNAKSARFRDGKIKRFNRPQSFETEQTKSSFQQFKAASTKNESLPKLEGTPSVLSREDCDLEHKMNLREEFYRIKEFIVRDLAPMLEYAEGGEVQKKIVLNIYMRWNRQQQRACLVGDTGKIQMELTNQLKICFPHISMNRKVFRGIQFRHDFTQQLQLTDRSPPFNEEQQFLEIQDPINELLQGAEDLLAGENQSGIYGGKQEKEQLFKDLDDDIWLGE